MTEHAFRTRTRTHPSPPTRPARLALALAAALMLAGPACADEARAPDADAVAQSAVQESGFVFKEIAVDEASARSGDGNEVSLGGKAVKLHGEEIRVGDRLRPATLRDPELHHVAATGEGRIRILSVVPSITTPTCEQQTHYLSEKSGALGDRVELVTISLDAPETQKQFAEDAGIDNVRFLSDADAGQFGRAHGLLIDAPRILARAVLVVDEHDVVRYLQVVPEVSHMPDMEAAFAAARRLADEGSGD